MLSAWSPVTVILLLALRTGRTCVCYTSTQESESWMSMLVGLGAWEETLHVNWGLIRIYCGGWDKHQWHVHFPCRAHEEEW